MSKYGITLNNMKHMLTCETISIKTEKVTITIEFKIFDII